ncbi:hypothetical protein BG004_000232 [Podila humilis]|nr:hypothetical protein BG004_000232 [Podila humilis]
MYHFDDDIQVTADLEVSESPEEYDATAQPKVLIVGAGIGGLFLGHLLHKGGVPFEIFERAKEVKPLGSAISLGSTVSTLFKQLDILHDFVQLGKFNYGWTGYVDDKPSYVLDTSSIGPMCDAKEYIVPRPDFHELLLRQVPKERIHMNKKVLNFVQNDLGTTIRCHDGTSYQGDIIVGADGTYSAVRQHLFKALKEKNQLPKSDDVPLPFDTVCLLGQTKVLSPEEFPEMKLPHSHFRTVIGEHDYLVAVFTTKSDTFCWMVVQYLNNNALKGNGGFQNSEWGPEAAESMCKDVHHLKIPYGKDENMTMGDLIDLTPKHLISKVMLEEIVFETWYGGRTVLLGDACHKLSPNAGQGAVAAIHDAVTLANWICSLETKTSADFERIFAEYQAERRPFAVHAYNASKTLKKAGARDIAGALIKFVYRHMPDWLMRTILKKSVLIRPQVAFLPLVEDKGTVPCIPQPSFVKTLPIFQERIEKQKAEAAAKAKDESNKTEVAAVENKDVVTL